jgi:hypothetical protein
MATTLDYKHLSNAVYGDPAPDQLDNWSLVQRTPDNDPTGYFGAAYQNANTGEIVFVHRGTQDLNDVHSDTQLAAGYVMDQYAKAEAFINVKCCRAIPHVLSYRKRVIRWAVR